MSIQQEIILRYRSEDHARFQIPEKLSQENAAFLLQKEILQIPGVYRVFVYCKQGKLAIHFIPELLSFPELAKQLSMIVNDLEKQGHLKQQKNRSKPRKNSSLFSLKEKIKKSGPSQWAKEKYVDTKDTARAVGILAKLGLKNKSGILKDPEKTMINFFNDILVLYLIKSHWHLITQHWILRPFRYRYEWLTVFYLMYLLVRSRMPEKK